MDARSRARIRRRTGLLAGVAAVLALAGLATATFGEQSGGGFFRIGTGFTGGTYFPVGSLIANAVSNPPGSRPCDRGGSCGVPGLIAVAISTAGSVANVEGIASGTLESGLCQADIAYWAYTGTGVFSSRGRVETLRAIANLYSESIHIVVSEKSGIRTVAGLKGKRIALGEKGSGTLVDAELILGAYGLKPSQLEAQHLPLGAAVDALAEGKIDGLVFVAGPPAPAIANLAERADIRLIPIDGPRAETLTRKYPFFAAGTIPAGQYKGVDATPTLDVGAQWVVSSNVSDDLVYGLTRALWNERTQQLLGQGHPKAHQIRLRTALKGIAIPLHSGAARYYQEAGMLKTETVVPPGDKPAAN